MTNLSEKPGSTTDWGRLHPLLHSQFLQEGLQEAILDAHCPRLMKFILKPVSIMRNGWLLAPDFEPEQNQSRSYILPSLPHKERPFVGQRLEIYRPEHKAVLISMGDTMVQKITLDLETFTVIDQTVEARAMS